LPHTRTLIFHKRASVFSRELLLFALNVTGAHAGRNPEFLVGQAPLTAGLMPRSATVAFYNGRVATYFAMREQLQATGITSAICTEKSPSRTGVPHLRLA
jgi:hypothetical protein